ncbi:hypothetical protein Tcan_15888 [Toxocara canis]|uniref:ZM domain-containing protein n=1 Tax=Toxocara canis TaxID=6265 RepID=A0A0B2V9E9_TOXCA|nr:hypothetical protein Tcan_15888 [Toxocara canis]
MSGWLYNPPQTIETAEEEYKSQFGSGPECPIGSSERHFDPQKSETLRAINEGDKTEFGKNFFEKVAQAEAPNIPPPTEPSWTEEARRRAERARSATPSAYSYHETTPYQTGHAPVYSSSYQPQRPVSQQSVRSERSVKKGYEFGGLDYVDRSRIPQETYYYSYNSLPSRGKSEERRTTPGYEMGGMDFRKGAVSLQGPYHGYGPEHPRLVPKFEKSSLRHDEMNIETAPNVNRVSADILIGDTISNQKKISDDSYGDQRYAFGTSFGPTGGFKRDHRSVHRYVEPPKAPVFSLSAKKDYIGQGNTGYSSSAHGRSGYTSSGGAHSYQQKSRSQSAAPMERYEWSDADKEVTVETLLSGRALIPRQRSVTPDWHTHSMEKHSRWNNISDPRLARSQTFTSEPNWSRTVRERRSAWEAQARDTDARVQMPASSKIPSQQPPHWYSKANQTHSIWQSAADRQASDAERYGSMTSGYSSQTQQHYPQRSYGAAQDDREHISSTTAAYQVQPYRQPSSHHETASYYRHEERQHQEERQQSGQAPQSSSFSSVQREHYSTEDGVPVSQSTYKTYTATPAMTGTQHGGSMYSQRSENWQSQQGAPLAVEEYRRARYEMKSHDSTSTERTMTRPFTTSGSSGYHVESGATHKTQQAVGPSTVTSKVITQSTGGEFDRKAEMAEVLPRGTIANTQANTEGSYLDRDGHNVNYKRELLTSVDPNRECSLLKEEERRVIETPLEPGVISRHVTTKYYKKKTVTDTTTTTTNATQQ